VTEEIHRGVLSLPMSQKLEQDELFEICSIVNNYNKI